MDVEGQDHRLGAAHRRALPHDPEKRTVADVDAVKKAEGDDRLSLFHFSCTSKKVRTMRIFPSVGAPSARKLPSAP